MHQDLAQKAQQYFQSNLGIPFDTLLTPISPEQPTGKSVRGNGVYSAIKEARREDDPTLPMGAWEHELKRADWHKVSDIAVHAIASKSKDLQLAAWLLEAQINLSGFDGIASCVVLMESLCNTYWEELHPQMEDGDAEYRANILAWANEKLLPAVRLIPITASGRGHEFHWGDWEQAKRNEKLKGAAGHRGDLKLEGATVSEFTSAMAATATESHTYLYRKLADALESLEALTATLDRLWGDEAPSMNALAGLLEQIQALVASELYKRGVRLSAMGKTSRDGDKAKDEDGDSGGGGDGDGSSGSDDDSGGGDGRGPIRNRADAYARLAEAADFLMHIEPHSPAPYLVHRAVEWGNLNTAELYHEVFVKFGGQLSIFDLLGIAESSDGNS